MSPARVKEGGQRGYIIPIGGAEKKTTGRNILKRFVSLAGGSRARIAIIPTASEEPGTGPRYEEVFRKLRVKELAVLPFDTRRECEDRESLEILSNATGVFLTGGNQLRLATTLGGTPVAKQLRLMNAGGVHIAGTSAGAAFLSEHMIAYGREGATPTSGMVSLSPGLGLTNRLIVDQHFRERDRLGRLLTALSFNPFAIGLGLDEDTAAFMSPDETIEVVGSGGITIVDPSRVEFSSMDSVREGEAICLLGIQLHVLTEGATYNLHTREAAAPPVGEVNR